MTFLFLSLVTNCTHHWVGLVRLCLLFVRKILLINDKIPGPTVLLTSDYIRRTLGPTIMESANEYKLSAWLGQQEDQHKIVLYQCDQSLTPWTQRCIRQADCILIVALATMEPSVGTIEKQLETIAVRTQKELILLHKEGGDKPRNTVHWLNARSWCSSHHHIQCPPRIFSRKHASRLVLIFYLILLCF